MCCLAIYLVLFFICYMSRNKINIITECLHISYNFIPC